MSSATDAPSSYQLERDWCYYVQFVLIILDVLMFVMAAKELVDEVDRRDSK